MAEFLVPNDGVRGIDIKTESGVKKLDADRRGVVSTDNPVLAKTLKAQGFTRAGVAISTGSSRRESDTCPDCGGSKFADQKICARCRKAIDDAAWLAAHTECISGMVCPCSKMKERMNDHSSD